MKKIVVMFSLVVFLLCSAIHCGAKKQITPIATGKAWLTKEAAPSQVNVDGIWMSDEWGKLTLSQPKGGQAITGTSDDGWKIDGVVSGKKIFLVFSDNVQVTYSAVLTAETDQKLVGVWANDLISEGASSQPMTLHR